MPNRDWNRLNPLQLARYAEYYAKMEFASYGYEVYTSEVDDHDIDFIVNGSEFTSNIMNAWTYDHRVTHLH